MAVISQDSLNQLGRSAARLLHFPTVVEFQSQEINVAQGDGEVGIPAAQVRQIPHGMGGMSLARGNIEPKPKGGRIVVAKRQRATAQAVSEDYLLACFITLHQSC